MNLLVPYGRLAATAVLLITTSSFAQSAPKSKQGATKSTQPAPKSVRGSAKAAEASKNAPQPKGLQTRVWVNRDTKVYHCPGSIYYGKTRNGEFMEEAQARGFGNRAVQAQGCNDVVTNGPAPLPMNSNAARRMVWVNTESGVYHCPNTADWGATRRGHYISESDASAAGHAPAAGKRCNAR